MMLDYRTKPEESPIAWCIQHQKFEPISVNTKLMRTVFRVHTIGIFPYCWCNEKKQDGDRII